MRILVAIGTRPEAIKLGPVVRALDALGPEVRAEVVVTAQHKELLHPMLDVFGLRPEHNLDLMRPDQSPADLVSLALAGLSALLAAERPDMVLVQGDTSTVVAAALAAFYQRVPVGHVEAGLRSGDMCQPFPEELNRRVASIAASVHFAPTEGARANLLAEDVPQSAIHVTGNTIVDAVRIMRPLIAQAMLPAPVDASRPLILVTAHRRESHGEPLRRICAALRQLSARYPQVQLVYPVHLNPNVRRAVHEALAGCPGILLLPPLEYPVLLGLLARASLVLTDSGGIQEEAACLGRPVLVLRNATERPEVVEAGFGEVVGTDTDRIVARACAWLDNPDRCAALASCRNPFGDGHSADRIAAILGQGDWMTPEPSRSRREATP